MIRKRFDYLSDYIVDQFDVKKLKQLIITYLDLIETFKIMIANDYFELNLNNNCEIKISGNQRPTKSKVESLTFNAYRNSEIMQDTILNMYNSFNMLNEMERRVFYATFFESKSDLEIMSEFGLYSLQLTKIRKSSIVKFCLATGLDKFVNIV